jgi:hypothetical protein
LASAPRLEAEAVAASAGADLSSTEALISYLKGGGGSACSCDLVLVVKKKYWYVVVNLTQVPMPMPGLFTNTPFW